MKKFLLATLVLMVVKTGFAQTGFTSYTAAKPFAEANAVKAYPSDKFFFYRDGNNVISYPSGKITYVIDGNEIKNPFGKTLYYLEGQNVKEFPTGNILYIIDGDKVKNPAGDIMYIKEENKVKRPDGKSLNTIYEDAGPLWITVCIINTGC